MEESLRVFVSNDGTGYLGYAPHSPVEEGRRRQKDPGVRGCGCVLVVSGISIHFVLAGYAAHYMRRDVMAAGERA